jgi:hypothetical protein
MRKQDKKEKMMRNNVENLKSYLPSGNSQFQVPGINYIFSDEPLWAKLVIFIISLSSTILIVCIIKEWIVGLLVKDIVASNITKMLKLIKGTYP